MAARTRDPKPLKSGRCARPECRKKIPEAALVAGDPFCSTACCHEWYGIDISIPPEYAGGRRQTYERSATGARIR